MSGAPRQYALAVFAAATEPLIAALRAVAERLDGDPALLAAAQDTDRDFAGRHAMVVALLPEGVPEAAASVLGTMMERGDLASLRAVVSNLDAMAAVGPGANVAVVTTPLPLEATERDSFAKALRAKYTSDIGVIFETDPEILGGVTVRVGDQIVDGSVSSKLSALSESLLTAH